MEKTTNGSSMRPTTFDQFTGQQESLHHLTITVEAAKGRGELPDHILFSGPPGVGKTTLAGIVAAELGIQLVVTSGAAIEKPSDVAAILTGLRGPAVVFCDEIHRLPTHAQEMIYPAMEDNALDIVIGEGVRARSVRVDIPPFCLIGATTQAGQLSAPLRSRFGLHLMLDLYSDDELAAVVKRTAQLLDMPLEHDAALEIAKRGRGTPRIANALVRRVRDYTQVHQSNVDAAAVASALDSFGVDRFGIDPVGRRVLIVLAATFNGGPVGGGTLASSVGESATTLEEVYEPLLTRLGFLARTPRGRVLTEAGRTYVGELEARDTSAD